ncbi:MAG: hypothetical protein ACREOK_13425 [Gemmatimonadaceae bacterium]
MARAGSVLLVAVLTPPAGAQDSIRAGPCGGLPVTAIEIDANRPQFRGALAWWRKFARALGLHHETTEPELIRRFVTLDVGRPCTEFRRSESERILRAQPYLSDATVTTERDGNGVRVHVSTVDEVPVVAAARVSGREIRALSLGTMNFLGAGMHVEGRWERYKERRHGFGGKIAHPQLLGRPYALLLDGMRRTLGENYLVTLSHPFYTDLQRIAWHSGYSVLKDYFPLRRPDHTALIQPVDRWMWNVGGVIRLGPPRQLVLIGGMLLGERVEPRHEFFFEDSLTARLTPTADTAGVRRYANYDVTHIAGVLGVRALTFSRMRGLDALAAEQDVGTGTQIGGTFGIQPLFRNPLRQAFAAVDAYAGARTERSFMAARIEAESRIDIERQEWQHMVASGRAAWYWQPRDRWTSELSVEGAGAWKTIFPFQLELGERRGGLRGHARSFEAGGQRLLARLEERLDLGRYQRDRAAFGVAAFTEAGRMWAGDVPFGMTTPVRTSVGLAILGAIPARSQRTLRAEIAVPLGHGVGARTELRFTVREPARGFWFDPPRIRWARLSSLPEQIFTWP